MEQLNDVGVVTTARGPIEYAVRGTGKPVVVLHGSPGGIDAADAMARFLPADEFQAIMLSRPGYLGTELGDRRTPQEQADLYAALLDELGIEKVGVLAWSGGGPSAFRFAATHPERTGALVAIACLSEQWTNPTPDLSSRIFQTTRVGDWLMKKLVEHQPLQVIQGAVSDESSLSGDEFDEHVKYIDSNPVKKQFVLDMALTASQTGRRKAGWDNDLIQFAETADPGWASINAPTLLVQGSADSDVLPENSAHAHAGITGSELLTLDRGTHFAFYTHPDSDAAQARAIEYLRNW
ncbi:alpha/beta fold hydrolase [Rhodococcoides yunnanense]|uniref:alpha/beta fold hydrolase n=1 Tax=Rhodococcoides yunnanense TaxID=278209 RepID=UPI0009353EC7|nr:alpha/beta hydrolase [Rhodococcus yunnanensis]